MVSSYIASKNGNLLVNLKFLRNYNLEYDKESGMYDIIINNHKFGRFDKSDADKILSDIDWYCNDPRVRISLDNMFRVGKSKAAIKPYDKYTEETNKMPDWWNDLKGGY